MSTAVIAPEPVARPRRGLASIKTMFSSSKRHTISSSIPTVPVTGTTVSEEEEESSTPSTSTSSKLGGAVSSLFPHHHTSSTSNNNNNNTSHAKQPSEKSIEKALEKEKKNQVKNAIQLSTVNDQGAFLPPTPLEKGYRDHFKDSDVDYFDTIISTPPERVRTFLSAAATISPEMFSVPTLSAARHQRNKRHTFASFPSEAWTPRPSTGSRVSHDEDQRPRVPPKDHQYSSSPPASLSEAAQITVLTASEDLSEALSDSMSSSLSSSPPSMVGSSSSISHSRSRSALMVPELMEDDEEEEEVESLSTSSSPRHSRAFAQPTKQEYRPLDIFGH